MQAELISIGTELLLGAITDTNATYIAQALQQIGLDLIFKTTVGDNEARIAQVIDQALNRVDVVITSGGLGPTIDDVTREAIARASGRPLEFRQELLDQIANRFHRFGVQMSDNNRRQAMVPQGAISIENPVGTAPIFILQTERGVIMTLPGVPREMKHLLDNALIPWLRDYIDEPAVIKSLILRTAGIGESQIDARITDLMIGTNPTVGLAAHSGQTDIRITAKAASEALADSMISPIAEELTRRLGAWIYGFGTEQIEESVIQLLKERGARLASVEAGTEFLLARRLQAVEELQSSDRLHLTVSETIGVESDRADTRIEELALLEARRIREKTDASFGVAVLIYSPSQDLGQANGGTGIAVVGPSGSRKRFFGWSSERADAPMWATTHALAMLRRLIVNTEEPTT